MSRLILLASMLSVILPRIAQAGPITVAFTAMVGAANAIDTGNVFGEGPGANLAGQVITGSVSINPGSLIQQCATGAACYTDRRGGAISVSFALNGVTSTITSSILGYFGNRARGSVSISDPFHGGSNYLGVGATTVDGSVQQSIGALFNRATLFSAYGGGDPAVAIASLARIGDGAGLVNGGVTFISPVEHLEARLLDIDVPEPTGLVLFGAGLAGLAVVRRRIAR
ncbi:MAG TPA: PEP-CTERM sorting domain-containing protein [Rhodopila sp.]